MLIVEGRKFVQAPFDSEEELERVVVDVGVSVSTGAPIDTGALVAAFVLAVGTLVPVAVEAAARLVRNTSLPQ